MNLKTKYRLIIGGIVLFFVVIIGLLLYFVFVYTPVPYTKLAQQFCDCTEKPEVKGSTAVLSNDDFKYRIALESCIGADFGQYANSLSTDDEKYYYLELFQAEVSKICPLKMSNVFVPIPRPPRPVRDTLPPTAINN